MTVEDVRTFETRSGNLGFVLRDDAGKEYTTFREAIGTRAQELEGRRVRIEFHDEQRDRRYRNVYLDKVEPASDEPGDGDSDPEEAAWRTAVDAAGT
ncbi:MAG TPA: hypothetical protein VH231_17995 [Solirubrobacteraceae bacterium]|nr:hypothetical protein [Solirubrobacteraceae bacterium]